MSNVLIGIIGVILFIGLALAGALFLGPRFQESTNNSRASAAVQAVSQVSNAANMYNVQEGKIPSAIDDATHTATTLIGGGYLKSVPANPTTGGAVVLDSTNKVVTMTLGGNASSICKAINKQTAGLADTAPYPTAAVGTAGCYADKADNTAATFTAFASV